MTIKGLADDDLDEAAYIILLASMAFSRCALFLGNAVLFYLFSCLYLPDIVVPFRRTST